MKHNSIYLFVLIFAVMLSFTSKSQIIRATAKLDTAFILLGDQVKLTFEIDQPAGVKISFPALPDTILEKIEVLERSKIDTVLDKEVKKLMQKMLITCFDSGQYRIPPYWFLTDKNGIVDSVASNGVSLFVHSMKIDTTKGPTDIKMPYGAPLTLKEVTPYILGVILAGAVIFLLLYSIKRKKKKVPFFVRPPKPKEPAHIIALRELDRIKDEKLWQKEKTKQYYSELTETLRVYIEDRYGIPAMEQTSDETIESFRIRKDLLNVRDFGHLKSILSLADLVKFAKYKPLPDEDSLTLTNAYLFVNDTKPVEVISSEPLAKNEDKIITPIKTEE
jgi:hypothetical protein